MLGTYLKILLLFILELPDDHLLVVPVWKQQILGGTGRLYLGLCPGATTWWTKDDIFHGCW